MAGRNSEYDGDNDGGTALWRLNGPQSQSQSSAMDAPASTTYAGIHDLLRILRRRRGLVALTITIIMGLTFIALLWMTPLYSSTAVVMVEPLDAFPGAAAATTVASPNEEARIATKVELLGSRALARRVVHNLNLEDYDEFTPSERSTPGPFARIKQWLSVGGSDQHAIADQLDAKDRDEAVSRAHEEAIADRLIDHVQIERVGKSHLIGVTALSQDPFLAALIANRLADTHIKSQISAARDTAEEQEAMLRQRVAETGQKLRQADRAVAEYRRAHGMPEQSQDMTQAQLLRVNGELVTASADSAASHARAAAAQASRTNPAITNASSPLLNDLRGQEAAVRKHLAELTSFYGSGYPEVAATNAQLAELRGRIEAEANRVAIDMRNEAGAVSARQGVLAGSAGALRSEVLGDTMRSVALRELEREAQTSQALYLSLLARLKELGGKADLEGTDMSFVSRAPVPDSPSYPKPERALAVAFVGSIILAIILALAAETFDDRLRSMEQVRRLLGLPTLAMVPELPPALAGSPINEMVSAHPRSFFAEALRNLVIEIEARRTHAGSQVVVVTSALPDEGKTTVALGIAAAAASIGRSAAMVDLDLRRHETGEGEDDSGQRIADVVSFLTDDAQLDDVLETDAGSMPFAAIRVDQPVGDPGGLLESPRVAQLLAELRQRFQLIVINAPPILPVRDAKTLSGLADGTLMVVRWGVTDADAARTAVEVFGEGLVGVVINRVDYNKHAKSGFGDAIEYAARSGGAYYQQGQLASKGQRLLPRWLGRA